jgi:hypothetical protein
MPGSYPGRNGPSPFGGVTARARWARRLLLGVSALAAVATLVVLLRPRHDPTPAGPAPATTSLATSPAVDERPGHAALVRCSLDSTPQDATVIRADSGAVVGRTPITIDLPRTSQAVAFRFEKKGYRSVVHKVIPDLDKAVRVDLIAAPAERTSVAPVSRAERPVPRSAGLHRKIDRAAPGRTGAGTRDASKQFRSATPVNPFDM